MSWPCPMHCPCSALPCPALSRPALPCPACLASRRPPSTHFSLPPCLSLAALPCSPLTWTDSPEVKSTRRPLIDKLMDLIGIPPCMVLLHLLCPARLGGLAFAEAPDHREAPHSHFGKS